MNKNLQDSGENSAIVQFVDHAIDAYRPTAIAERIEASGISKAGLGIVQTMTLAVLAGAFIAFGAMLFTLVMTDSGL